MDWLRELAPRDRFAGSRPLGTHSNGDTARSLSASVPSTEKTALELVHRLLFRAMIEIREQGREQKNKLVYHLADLFHNVVLDMEAAAEGRLSFEDVLYALEDKAKEKNCERWLLTTRTQIELEQPSNAPKSATA